MWKMTAKLVCLSSVGALVQSGVSTNAGETMITPADNNNPESGTITFPLVPHHIQRSRLGLKVNDYDPLIPRHRRQEAQQVGALYHGYGTHYVDLWCGSPPQRQTVIVDTGSGVTAFPCRGCKDCGAPQYHIDGYFDDLASSSFEKVACDQCSSRAGSCNSEKECRIGTYSLFPIFIATVFICLLPVNRLNILFLSSS
jgi:hypothetical protein